LESLMHAMGEIRRRAGLPEHGPMPPQLVAELGAAALRAETETEESRLATVKAYLPLASGWPERPLRITALDTADGSLVVWNRNSKATLLEAVASSCAAPMIAPPTTIGGRRYMDAAVLSGTHAQLAAGQDLVIVVAVARPGPPGPLEGEVAALRNDGSRVEIIRSDAPSTAAMLPNPLDYTRCKAAAEAGLAQGLALAEAVRRWLE
jgi:NTE family protein